MKREKQGIEPGEGRVGQVGISVAQGAGKKNLGMGRRLSGWCAHVFTYGLEFERKERRWGYC